MGKSLQKYASSLRRPRFVHDCDRCIFLGGSTIEGGRPADFYWCPDRKSESMSSMIARYGDEGREYLSSSPPEAFADPLYLLQKRKWYRTLLRRAHRASLYANKRNYNLSEPR